MAARAFGPATSPADSSAALAQLCSALNSLTNGCGSTDGLTALADALEPTGTGGGHQRGGTSTGPRRNGKRTRRQHGERRARRSKKSLRRRPRQPRLPQVRLRAATTFPNAQTAVERRSGLSSGDARFGGKGSPASPSDVSNPRQADEHEYFPSSSSSSSFSSSFSSAFGGGGGGGGDIGGNALALFEDDFTDDLDHDRASARQPPRRRGAGAGDGHRDNQLNKKRGRDTRHGDRGDAKRRNTRSKQVKSGQSQETARRQRHVDELNYLNGIVETQAGALYGALHKANGGGDSLATDRDGDDSERSPQQRGSRWKLPSLDPSLPQRQLAWPKEVAFIMEAAVEQDASLGVGADALVQLHQRRRLHLQQRQQHLAKQGALTMIAAGARGLAASLQHADTKKALPDQYIDGAKVSTLLRAAGEGLRHRALTPLHDASREGMELPSPTGILRGGSASFTQEQDDASGILTTITNSTAGDPFFPEKGSPLGSSVGLLMGDHGGSDGEDGLFPAGGGILDSMLLATSEAAQATMIDGDAVESDTDEGGEPLAQTVEREPATVLDSQFTTLVDDPLLDGSVFYTQRELEKKLWRRHHARYLREQELTIMMRRGDVSGPASPGSGGAPADLGEADRKGQTTVRDREHKGEAGGQQDDSRAPNVDDGSGETQAIDPPRAVSPTSPRAHHGARPGLMSTTGGLPRPARPSSR